MSLTLRGLAALLLLWTFEAAPAQADKRSVRSRDGQPVTGARVSPPSATRSGRPSARDTRQNPPRHSTRRDGRRHDHHYRGRHYYYGGFGHYYYPRLGFSYWGYPFYWGYYYPGVHYGYYGAPYRSFRGGYHLGALDLNVKPKKAEVYVDGEYVGLVRDYDGFPSYLWLERGSYQISFYLPGYRTESFEIKVLSGAVVPVRLRLAAGEAVKPERIVRSERAERRRYDEERRTDRARPWDRPRGDEPVPPGERDVRGEPGRVRLEVSPPDASVYLDGRFLGSGEEVGRLHSGLIVEPGEHVLEVVRPGFESERLEFEVEGGDDLDLEVRLSGAAA